MLGASILQSPPRRIRRSATRMLVGRDWRRAVRRRPTRLQLRLVLLLLLALAMPHRPHDRGVVFLVAAAAVDLPVVLALLERLGLSLYGGCFRQLDQQRVPLVSVTADQMKEYGVAVLGHRKKILKHLHELRHAEPAQSQCGAALAATAECDAATAADQLAESAPAAPTRSRFSHGVEEDDSTPPDPAGWQSEAHPHRYDTDRCTVDIRTHDMTLEEFLRDFHLRKPVLIVPNSLRAEQIRRTRRHWSKVRLQQEHGDFEVTLGTPHQLTAFGDGRLHMTLARYIDEMARATATTADDNASSESVSRTHYLFDRNKFFKHNPALLQSYSPPPLFQPSEVWSETYTFALGPTGTGINFHYHKDGWNEVIYGRKRWLLYPPSVGVPPFGYNQFEPAAHWFRAHYASLTPSQLPIECVQRSGETLYIPEDWFHSTINIGETIAVAGQARQTSEGTLMDHVTTGMALGNAGRKAEALEHYESALRGAPLHAQLYNLLGNHHRSVRRPDLAVTAYRQAVHFNPQYAMAWASLGQLQLQQHDHAAALVSFQHANRLGPDQYETVFGLGTAMYLTGDLAASADVLARSIDVFLRLTPKQRRVEFDEAEDWSPARASFVNLAGVYNLLQQPERALAIADQWIARAPNDAAILMAQAYSFRLLHRYTDAIAIYRRILADEPDANAMSAQEQIAKCQAEERQWKGSQSVENDSGAAPDARESISTDDISLRSPPPTTCDDWRCELLAVMFPYHRVDSPLSLSASRFRVWQTYSTDEHLSASSVYAHPELECIHIGAPSNQQQHHPPCVSVASRLPRLASSAFFPALGVHAAVLALSSLVSALPPDSWIALTTWDESQVLVKEKGFQHWLKGSAPGLPSAFLRQLERLSFTSIHGSVDRALVGVDAGVVAARMPEHHLYTIMESKHPGAAAQLLAILQRMGVSNTTAALPEMPRGIAFYRQRWAMASASLQIYVKVVALFLDAASAMSSEVPPARLAILLERLPMIWAFHSGRPLLYTQTWEYTHEQRGGMVDKGNELMRDEIIERLFDTWRERYASHDGLSRTQGQQHFQIEDSAAAESPALSSSSSSSSDSFYSSLILPLVFPSELQLELESSWALDHIGRRHTRSSSSARIRLVHPPGVFDLVATPPVLDDPLLPTFAGCNRERRREREQFCRTYLESRCASMAFPVGTHTVWMKSTEGRLWSQSQVFEVLGEQVTARTRAPVFLSYDGLVSTHRRAFTFEKICVAGLQCLVEEMRHMQLGTIVADGPDNAARKGEFKTGVGLGWTMQLQSPLLLTGAAMLAAYDAATPAGRRHSLAIQTDHQARTAATFASQLSRVPAPPEPVTPGRIVRSREHGLKPLRMASLRCAPVVHHYPALVVPEQFMATVNYAHFLNEVGPKILIMRPLLVRPHSEVRLLLQPNTWTLDWLELAGIPRDRVVFTHPCVLHTADRVYLTTPLPLDAPSMQSIALSRSVLMRSPLAFDSSSSVLTPPPGSFPVAAFSPSVVARKAALFRSDLPYIISLFRPPTAARSVSNDEQVEAELRRAFSMRVVRFDAADFTLAETVQLFKQASAVIGMVGAGFGNMIFLSAGATVIQLIPGVTHPRLPCGLTPWWHIAELMHLPVRSFVIEQARFDQTTPVEMPMQEFATFIQKIKGTVQVRRPQW